MCGNQVMLLLINTVRDGVRGFMPLLANLAGPQDHVRKHHRELIAAIERGDVADRRSDRRRLSQDGCGARRADGRAPGAAAAAASPSRRCRA